MQLGYRSVVALGGAFMLCLSGLAETPSTLDRARYESVLRLKAIVDDERLIDRDEKYLYGVQPRVDAAALLVDTVLKIGEGEMRKLSPRANRPYEPVVGSALRLCEKAALNPYADLDDRLKALKVLERARLNFSYTPDLEAIAKKIDGSDRRDPRVSNAARALLESSLNTERMIYKFGGGGTRE